MNVFYDILIRIISTFLCNDPFVFNIVYSVINSNHNPIEGFKGVVLTHNINILSEIISGHDVFYIAIIDRVKNTVISWMIAPRRSINNHMYFFPDNISILPFSHYISPLFFVVRIWTGEDPLISIGILYDSTHTTVIGLGVR